jgi:copper chaperone NosL
MKHYLILIVALLFAACEPTPKALQAGADECQYCRMMITEAEFASQALNKQGRSFFFDSIECLAAWEQTSTSPEKVHSLWVPDFMNPSDWVLATEASFLHSTTLRSPMGLYLSGYKLHQDAVDHQHEFQGILMQWDEVRALVRKEWSLENAQL